MGMARGKPAIIEYTPENLDIVINAIRKNLTKDLLPKKYLARNSENAMYGHCHNASGCLYKLFGCENVHLYRALDDWDVWHWWVQDRTGKVIDITASQYEPGYTDGLYVKGQKAGLLGFGYKKKVRTVLVHVLMDENIKKIISKSNEMRKKFL